MRSWPSRRTDRARPRRRPCPPASRRRAPAARTGGPTRSPGSCAQVRRRGTTRGRLQRRRRTGPLDRLPAREDPDGPPTPSRSSRPSRETSPPCAIESDASSSTAARAFARERRAVRQPLVEDEVERGHADARAAATTPTAASSNRVRTPIRSAASPQRVSDAVDGLDPGRAGERLQLPAQPPDVHVERVVVNDRAMRPGCLDQLPSPDRVTRGSGEPRQ